MGCPNQKWFFSICGPCQIFWNASISHRDGFLPLSLPSGQDHSRRNPICLPFWWAGACARSLSHFMDVPLIAATHQHNHMFAGLWGLRRRPPARCLLVHVSGGTTDLLLAERSANGEIILTPCGTSIDLHAGQMIDRVGVALGLPFPCGPQLEKLAQEAVRPYPLKVWFEEGCMSLSGPATAALRAIEKGEKGSEIALGTLHAIAKGLYHTISHLCAVHKLTEVLFCWRRQRQSLYSKRTEDSSVGKGHCSSYG